MIHNKLTALLQTHSPLILDGALATELEHRGCNLNDPLWSAKVLIEQPNLIKQIHLDYFKAGADIATSASYQATFQGFAQKGLSETEAAELMQFSVQLALEARNEFWANPANRHNRPKPLVAASIGSYGAYLADGSEYRGDYNLNQQDLINFHRPRLAVLAATQADILAFETIPCHLEAQALAHLLTEFPTHTAWLSFSAKDQKHISHGETLADCVTWLNNYPQIAAVGINCTHPQYITALIKQATAHTTKPIIIYPNSGEIYLTENKTWQGTGHHHTYGKRATKWHQAGATIIGGCCRTTPADIKQIAKLRINNCFL